MAKDLSRIYDKELISEFPIDDVILVIVAYPELKGFIVAKETGIRIEVIPEIDMAFEIVYLPGEPKCTTLAPQFFNTVPQNIKDKIKLLPAPHWMYLKAARDIGEHYLTLIDNNPALAVILAHLELFNSSYKVYLDFEHIRRIILKKQKELLTMAGFPAKDRVINLLRKLPAEVITPANLFRLRHILCYSAKEYSEKLLHEVNTVNTNLISALSTDPLSLVFCSRSFIEELVNDQNFDVIFAELRKFSQICRFYKIEIQLKKFSNYPIYKQRIEDRLLEEKAKRKNYPAPPFDGNEFIKPIESLQELRRWSFLQQNCIKGYGKRVMERECYFYRINYNNEEATFEIKLKNGKYYKGALLGKNNTQVSNVLSKLVSDWFNSQKKTLFLSRYIDE